MTTIIDLYNQGLAMIPEAYRLPLAALVIFFLVFSLVKFIKKNLVWIILFVILLPAAWPAIKQIGLWILDLIQSIPK